MFEAHTMIGAVIPVNQKFRLFKQLVCMLLELKKKKKP